MDSNPDLPLTSCEFPGKSVPGFRPLFSHLSNRNAGLSLLGKDQLRQEPQGQRTVRLGSSRSGGGGGRGLLGGGGGHRDGPVSPRALQGHGTACSPRGWQPRQGGSYLAQRGRRSSPAQPRHILRKPDPPHGPTPRQTLGSRPAEAHGCSTAPREPDPRGGGSGSNLNTSPADPPHHAPPLGQAAGS